MLLFLLIFTLPISHPFVRTILPLSGSRDRMT